MLANIRIYIYIVQDIAKGNKFCSSTEGNDLLMNQTAAVSPQVADVGDLSAPYPIR